MRATALASLFVVVAVVVGMGSSPAGAQGASLRRGSQVRIFVTPILNDADLEISRTLTKATETALQAAVPNAEIVTPAALDSAIEVSTVRDCVGPSGGGHADAAADSCLSELADAVDVDFIARPHLGRVGDDLVLTLSILDGHRAVVLAQGMRRVRAATPAALLDVVPELAIAVARDADLRAHGVRPLPVVPIVVGVSGLAGAGLGAAALVIRGSMSGDYEHARLDRGQAQAYELIDAPFLWGGVGLAVVGGVVALGGSGLAVWTILSEKP